MTRFRLLLALLVLLAFGGAAPRPVTVFDLSDALGKPAPPVTLIASDGTPIAFNALRGKPTYIFLFASWCGPCRQAFPFVREDYAKYGDRVQFVAVDVLEGANAARAAIAKADFAFPVAIYPIEELDALVAPDVQLHAGAKYRIPADFLLDASGVVRFAWHGLQVTDAGDPVDVLPGYLAQLGIR